MTKSNETKYHLTNRELQVLYGVTQGKTNNEIAKELFVSSHTIKFYVSSIFYKLSVESRSAAAVKAVRENLVNI